MQSSIVYLLTCACWLLSPFFDFFNVSLASEDTNFVIVIDPGHGGRDGGCVGAPHNEKDIVLDISLQLGEMISSNYDDVEVLFTRDSDRFIPLHKRAKLANSHQADLFISVHCNSLPQAKQVGGSETYVMGLSNAASNLNVAKRENAAILLEDDYEKNYMGYDPNSDEGHILLSMVQNIHLDQSLDFADKIEKSIAKHAHGHSRGVKQAGFMVLRQATMPAVLVETGYLTNTTDNDYLQEAAGRTEMAKALFIAFSKYKAQADGNEEAEVTLAKNAVKAPVPIKKAKPIVTSKNEVQKTFYIQLAASQKLLNTESDEWKKAPHKVQVKKEDKYYKYLSPGFNSLDEAKKWRAEYAAAGFSNCFIVSYLNGQRVKPEK